jgi:hypothetical protein
MCSSKLIQHQYSKIRINCDCEIRDKLLSVPTNKKYRPMNGKSFLMNEVRPFQLASCITHSNHEYFVPKNSDHVALWHTTVVTVYILGQ